jgi:hypothetical protein
MRRSRRCSIELKSKLVDVTPVPVLSGFVGSDDGMGGSEEVLGGVPSRRLITASDVAALLAQAQMNPVLTA